MKYINFKQMLNKKIGEILFKNRIDFNILHAQSFNITWTI